MSGRRAQSSYTSRESEVENARKRLFLIAEGKTESDYFRCIRDKQLLKGCIFFDFYDKDGIDLDESDRSNLIELAHDYMEKYRVGKMKLYTYITLILNDYYMDKYPCYDTKKNDDSQALCKQLREFRTYLMEKYEPDVRYSKGFVQNPNELYVEIVIDLDKKFNTDYKFTKTDSLQTVKNSKIDDEVYIIFDRDHDEKWRNDQMYKGYIELCSSYHYNALVSTPQFELWLLMHFPGANFGVPSYDKKYGDDIVEKLKKYDSGKKSKMKDRFILYEDKIKNAILCSKNKALFRTDLDSLCRHAGTNLGQFMEKIIDPTKLL